VKENFGLSVENPAESGLNYSMSENFQSTLVSCDVKKINTLQKIKKEPKNQANDILGQ